ncbi:hypothetical protein KR018_006830 [Drosophila ironensis]|nr:hypothetical protein KR018_006830 [Drosophila ironensis]
MSWLALMRTFAHQSHRLTPGHGLNRLSSAAALHWTSRLRQEASPGLCPDFPGISSFNAFPLIGSRGGALQQSQGPSQVSTDVRPIGEKIKENTKTASYTAIIVAGLGVTCVMFFAIFRELFSCESPNNIYAEALNRVVEDPRVQDAIGAPIKGFGETSRRGRRQHVAHSSYERNGKPHMRMQFYVQGLRNKATVQLESRRVCTDPLPIEFSNSLVKLCIFQSASGKREYRYLFVQLDHYPHTTIVLEDNRAFDPAPEPSSTASSFGNLALMSNVQDK